MHRPLLNSSVSVDFNIGPCERLIPHDLENRIIRYETAFDMSDLPQIEEFFRTYDQIREVEGKATKAVAEYFLESFFGQVQAKGWVDVSYFGGEPGETISVNGLFYEFVDNGKAFRVFRNETKDQAITEVSRLVEVRRGKRKQAVICDARTTKNPAADKNKIMAVRNLLGKETEICYLGACSINTFQKYVRSKVTRGRFEKSPRSRITTYLSSNPLNLALVYSATSEGLNTLGSAVLERL